jgi:hypothetical protein
LTPFDPYDSLVPVFLGTDLPKRFGQIGSAIFLKFQGEPLLLTAAHVTDELKNGTLFVPTDDGLLPIEGYIASIDLPPEIPRTNDDTDFAYYRLSSRFAAKLAHHFTPFPASRTRLIQSAHELTVCTASGYPASKGKKNNDGNFSSEIFSFRGVIADDEIYSALNLSPESSIVFHFHKKRAIHSETFESFSTPGLKGISGGAIFAWPAGSETSNDWTLPSLVGIVHTFKERDGLIIGTALVPVVAAIGLGRMKDFGGVR